MRDILHFLLGFRNDFFKLLPMREQRDLGNDNHLENYAESLLANAKGGLIIYPELAENKQYLYAVNNLAFLTSGETIDFGRWRKIVLTSTKDINNLYVMLGGEKDGKRN